MPPDATSFSFEPIFLALPAAAAILYARAARHDPPGALRLAAFVLGLLVIAVPLNSPLETLAAHYLLLAHLLQNALIADWAPLLLIVGLTPGMRAALRARGGAAFELLTRPVVSLPLWLTIWYGVHVPAFYEWALRAGWPLNLEHALLIGAGLLYFWPLFEPEPRRLGVESSLVYLALGFVATPWLALAYTFSTGPFYSFYEQAPRLAGYSATKDQNLGGILMQAEMTLVFLILIGHFLLGLLANEDEKQRRQDEADRIRFGLPPPPGLRQADPERDDHQRERELR